MHRLTKERVEKRSVTPLQDLTQSNRAQSKAPFRAAAAFLVVGVAAAGILAQLRSTVVPTTADATSSARSVAPSQDLAPASPNDQPADNLVTAQASVSETKDGAYHPPQAKVLTRAAPLAISVEPSQVRSDDHFAEIRLHRNLVQKNGSFTWWTEPATAKPDVDYVPEAVAVQTFPDGYRTARLYVRLLPQSLRSQRSYFYIAIAQTGPHQASPTVIRRQIWLPMSSSLQARR